MSLFLSLLMLSNRERLSHEDVRTGVLILASLPSLIELQPSLPSDSAGLAQKRALCTEIEQRLQWFNTISDSELRRVLVAASHSPEAFHRYDLGQAGETMQLDESVSILLRVLYAVPERSPRGHGYVIYGGLYVRQGYINNLWPFSFSKQLLPLKRPAVFVNNSSGPMFSQALRDFEYVSQHYERRRVRR